MMRFLLRTIPLMLVLGAACSRVPARPPALPDPVTRLYSHGYLVVWDTVRVDLVNDPRLDMDTIDKAGRFVAWEKTNSLFLLLNARNVVTVALEPVGADKTRMVLQMHHEKYDTGGWRRPAGWYPSPNVNEELGQVIASRIDQRLRHTPGLADRVSAPPAAGTASPPARGAAPAAPPPPERERRGWRRFWPFGRGDAR